MSDTLLAFIDNPFWQFSLKTYSHEQVKNHCLSLQQEFDFNVNLLLFCCWLADAQILLERQQFTQAISSAQHWHIHVTKPLRQTRTYLAALENDRWLSHYYKHLLTTEIHSESFQQQQLYRSVKDVKNSSNSDKRQQSMAYLQWLVETMDLPLTPALQEKLDTFLDLATVKRMQ